MALKRKLKKEEHDALADAVKALYTAQQDGTFLLDAEPDTDIAGLTNTIAATRAERDALQKQLKAFEGVDVAEYRRVLATMDNDEEQKMLKAGKSLDEIFAKRTENLRKDFEKKLAAAEEKATAAAATSSKFTKMVLDSHLRKALGEAKAFPEAAEAGLLLGQQTWSLDADGNPVALKDGEPIIGKDGKSKLSLTEWAETLKETAPYLFPAPSGGGTPSNGKGGGGIKVIKETDWLKLPPAERAAKVNEGYTIT